MSHGLPHDRRYKTCGNSIFLPEGSHFEGTWRTVSQNPDEIFLQAMQFGGAGDRNDPGPLRQQPRERDLRRGHALARGDLSDEIDERLTGLERLGRKAWHRAAEIFVTEGGVRPNLAGRCWCHAAYYQPRRMFF